MGTKRERMEKERRESLGRSTGDAYLKIHENFLREDYAEVDRLANGYLSGDSSKPNSEDVLYLQALSLLKLNRGDEARVKLRDLENSFVSTDRKASASASIADSYDYEGNLSMATQAYEETLRKYPNSDQTNYAQFKLKELYAKLGRPRDADRFRTRTPDRNPGNARVKDSVSRPSRVTQVVMSSTPSWKQLSLEETSLFTVQVGSFAKVRNADALMNKLIHRHYTAYIDKDASSGMYRVRVGRLSNKSEADSLEAKLKSEGYPTKIVP